MSPADAPTGLILAFATLGLAMAAFDVWALRRVGARRAAIAVVAWLALTGGLAASGALAVFEPVPRIAPLLALGMAGTLWISLGPIGGRLARMSPMWLLIGFQVFRIPVELALHSGSLDGVVPPLMTWSGRNFDVIVGLLAVPLARLAARDRLPRWAAWVFAVGGLVLVVNVAVHGALAMPGPLQQIETVPANTWIVGWPFVWLPMILVTTAIAGQLILMRRLLSGHRLSADRNGLPAGSR